MTFTRIRYAVQDSIALIELSRPDKMNAYDLEMFCDLRNAQKLIANNRDVRAVLISAQGDDFSSGLDVKTVMNSPKAVFKLLWKWSPWSPNLAQSMSYGWRTLPVPVIFAVTGRCWGAGLQTILGGDFRFCSKDCSLSIMESKWGLIPDMGGSIALRELVSIDKALEWTMTSKEISSDEALKAGLITHSCDDPLKEATHFAYSLLEKSPDCLAGVKRLYQCSWSTNSKNLLAKEWLTQWRILLGSNRKIAVMRAKDKKNKINFKKRGIF